MPPDLLDRPGETVTWKQESSYNEAKITLNEQVPMCLLFCIFL